MKHIQSTNAIVVAFSIALSGWFIGQSFFKSRADDRYVSVKGLAEREVEADRAVWAISFVAASNELTDARNTLAHGRTAIFAFLERHNIAKSETELQNLRILDQLAKTYSSEHIALRYLLQQTVLVRTGKIDAVAQASQDVAALLDAGVLLGNIEGYHTNSGPQYIYTQLNTIKPTMIAEATGNARKAAMQFAIDADTEIEGIRRARQGQFVISPAENASGLIEAGQIHKKVRVVVTLDYILGQ